ncbi:MAG: hypothetical protein ACRCVV_03790 [Shewanella sp.]
MADQIIRLNPDWDLHEFVDGCTQHTNAMVCCVWSAPCVGTTRLFATSIEVAKGSNDYQYNLSKYGREPRILVWDWGWEIAVL